MTQPTALFLADILESRNGNPTGFGLGPVCDKAAAELRRLHAQRKPLTEEEIDALDLPPSGTATVRDFVRIIERAHGIT